MRNGSISSFFEGIDLRGDGSIVEGLRVGGPCPCGIGISAKGIVRGNTTVGIADIAAGGSELSLLGRSLAIMPLAPVTPALKSARAAR